MNTKTAIKAAGLTRKFGSFTAVDDLSFEIRTGEVVALLGKNGAGKTTTFSMLLGLDTPTSGSAEVMGMKPAAATQSGLVGAVLQNSVLLDNYRVGEMIQLIARMQDAMGNLGQVIDQVELEPIMKKKVGKLSGGEKQRLRLGMALLTQPEVIVLDEPTAGLDVYAQKQCWDLFKTQAEAGRTIIFATHILSEAQAMADRILIMNHGRLVEAGSLSELNARHSEGVQVTAAGEVSAGLAEELDRRGCRWETSVGTLSIRTHESDDVAKLLLQSGDFTNLRIQDSDLDEVFTKLTGENLSKESK